MSLREYLSFIEDNIGPVILPEVPPTAMVPLSIPPEGIPTAGAKTSMFNTQLMSGSEVWEMHEKDGHKIVVLNEIKLKEVLHRGNIIIEGGEIRYDIVNGIVSFLIHDLVGTLRIGQFESAEIALKYYAIQRIRIEPELRRISAFLAPGFTLGGIGNGKVS